jgi:tRNA dimethylallyltransferase
MKAVAVPELLAHVSGRVDLDTALARALVQTRRYAKRQLTWLRHQLPELRPVTAFGEDLDPRRAMALARPLLTTATLAH